MNKLGESSEKIYFFVNCGHYKSRNGEIIGVKKYIAVNTQNLYYRSYKGVLSRYLCACGPRLSPLLFSSSSIRLRISMIKPVRAYMPAQRINIQRPANISAVTAQSVKAVLVGHNNKYVLLFRSH